MPSSDDHQRHAAAAANATDKGSGSDSEPEMDDDEEYEEIEEEVEVEEEVEEEVEVEEEEEEEEEEEVEEIGDDFSDSPIAENRNDVSQGLEYRGHEEQLRSLTSTPGKSVANQSPDSLAVEGSSSNSKFSGPSETRQKDELRVNSEDSKFPKVGKHPVTSDDNGLRESTADKKDSGVLQEKRTPPEGHDDGHSDSKAHLSNSDNLSADSSKPFGVTGKEVAAAIPMRDGFGEVDNGVMYSEEKIKQMGVWRGEDLKQRASRSAVPQIRPRSLSPGTEIRDENKRPAVICDFFAKGWCIKGNSCKFLHMKDHEDISSQSSEGDVVAANQKSELQADEGVRDSIERSLLPGFPDAAVSSVAYNTSSSLERIPSLEHGESPRWYESGEKHKVLSLQRKALSSEVPADYQQLPLYKDNPRSISPLKDVGREHLRQNWCSEDFGNYASTIGRGSSPIYRKSLFHEQGSFSSISDAYRRTGILSYATNLEEMAGKRGQYMLNDRSSPVLSCSPNSPGMLPSHHNSAWTRSSLSFTSLGKDPLHAQKILDTDREHVSRSSFLLRNSSPFSGSELENFSRSGTSGDSLHSAGHKAKISSYDWEPSVPFRPSFLISPQSISSPGSQYDPIRDSIEQPRLGDGFSKFSSSGQGTSILSTHLPMNGDPVLTRTLGADYSSDKHSISTHHKFHDNVLDHNYYRKDLNTTAAEVGRTSVAECQNKNTLPKEDKLLSSAHVKDIKKANKIDTDRGFPSDGPRRKKEVKVERARANSDMDVDLKTDGDEIKESKTLKHFRAALVDFVKELVKPTWREGHLSKDAHKMIVKKAVDKVLSTLQPNQIPNTVESIKQYFSSSQPKIAKLVEGYVEKYGKS